MQSQLLYCWGKSFFCKYQEHNSTYSSRKKIKIGRLPDDKAKEKKQVEFHAGEVCYLRPM